MTLSKQDPTPASWRPISVAILSVSDPVWEQMAAALHDLGSVIRIETESDLLHHVDQGAVFDAVLVAHWRWVVPETIRRTWRCIGFHCSPLPKGRGGSPIQNQILRGQYESEVCAFQLTNQLDAGDVYLRRPIDLKTGTISEILDRVATQCGLMAREILKSDPQPLPQEGTPSEYKRLRPSDNELHLFGLTARQIYDRIRMVDGLDYPCAFQTQHDWKLEFRNANLRGGEVSATVVFRPRLEGSLDA